MLDTNIVEWYNDRVWLMWNRKYNIYIPVSLLNAVLGSVYQN